MSEPTGKFIRLRKRIRGDFMFSGTYADPGVYEAYSNPNGAISIKPTVRGKYATSPDSLLGLRPGEFEWVSEHNGEVKE